MSKIFYAAYEARMAARDQLVKSLQALVVHLDSGGIQDTALPGTHAAEATRLLKNGLSVSAFACFEHFIRSRIAELLGMVEQHESLPPFRELPEGLQLAATKGVVDALRFRLNLRDESIDTTTVVETTQLHAVAVASSHGRKYSFSEWAFGWSSSNVGAGVLRDFLCACGANNMFNEIGELLKGVEFDYAAVGLADKGALKLSRMSSWRHEAAHDATVSIDIQLLRSRVVTYLAIAFSFDVLASLAVRCLMNRFDATEPTIPDRKNLVVMNLRPRGEGQYALFGSTGESSGTYYSAGHCKDSLGEKPTPVVGAVVIRDHQEQIVDWFFH